MAYAIKCQITESYLVSVSFVSQTLTITKNKRYALPFTSHEQASGALDGLASPNAWPDYDWKVVEV